MAKVPEKVLFAFNELKKNERLHIVLKKINEKYYIYVQSTAREKGTHKVRTISKYFGRITEEGAVLRKQTNEDIELENAKSLIEARGGKVLLPQASEEAQKPFVESETDAKILKMLSMNARMEQKEMAKRIGLKIGALRNKINDLEKCYGIRYTTEINTSKLGYRSHFVFVKFEDEKPSRDALKLAIEGEGRVQFAALTTGAYDLIIYLLAESDVEISDTISRIRANTLINSYPSDWYATPLYEVYGFIPLREEFFEILKEKIWHRAKVKSNIRTDVLFHREYVLLKELNANSTESFSTVDKNYQLGKGGARYAYLALKERGVLKRTTITYSKPPIKSNAILILNIFIRKDFDTTRSHLMHFTIEDKHSFINKLSFASDIKVPNGVLYIFPIVKDGDLINVEEELKKKVTGIKLTSIIITDPLVGELGNRKFDTAHSTQYDHLIAYYKEELSQSKETYE
ncbi:MAG: Lrp/AsnC family transcriptional regulator [Candidatus Marsarchaeota archaeon]|nr:Lrp/AsnC family transcriptional regulator [Candidatus Marsarchaeota archaeon]